MHDDVLDQLLARDLSTFADGGIRPIDPLVVAETAMRSPHHRLAPTWWPVAGVRTAGAAGIAIAVVIVLAVANLGRGDSQTGVAGSSSSPVTTGQPVPTRSLPDAISPGPYDIDTSAGIVHLTVPGGWRAAPGGSAIFTGDESYEHGTNDPSLGVLDVTSVVADACPNRTRDPVFVPVGPTVEDFTTALVSVAELEHVGPTDVVLGGHPAKRLVLTLPRGFESTCGGPEGRIIWKNATASPFGVLNGGVATVYVVDVEGVRLVIATHYRGASRDAQLELAHILHSIRIDPAVAPGLGP
jgi:hypothetical protein